MRIRAVQADITRLALDAIVNAANPSLLGGGGVDGAIHRAAGHGLLAECRLLGGCNPGDAKITGGHQLPARHVIHTVGPIWQGGVAGEREVLASCYWRTLELAVANEVQTLAFPSISTGVYGYPIEQAARVAVESVTSFLAKDQNILEVTFCCFSGGDLAVYERLLAVRTGHIRARP